MNIHSWAAGARSLRSSVFVSLLAVSPLAPGQAATLPQPLAYEQRTAAPADRAFAGTIRLDIDATDTARKIFRVRERIPVQGAGHLTLLYPQWEPSSHAPTIPASNLAGLVVRAGGAVLRWQRDPVDMHAFHVEVPAGVDAIEAEFDYVTRAADRVLLAHLINLQWQRALLYPAGWFARNIPVQANLTVPEGLQIVSSLAFVRPSPSTVAFAPVSLETLSDSPAYAARHARSELLSRPGQAPVRLRVLAADEAGLAYSAAQARSLRRLVAETLAVFGRAPYPHFDKIVVLDDELGPGGVEHADSAEINLPAGYFREPHKQLNNLDLIAHEHVHAWNGRLRQPADLWTPTLNVPIRNSLLWLYEGQTEFWGRILAARAGLRNRQQTLDKLALDAAEVQARVGRAWKPLQDTTNDPVYISGRPIVWADWQRRKDYYGEGVLLWLDIDATLRERSQGRFGLDDFARRFFRTDAVGEVRTYTFEEICGTLNGLAPMDWASYLRGRLDAHDAGVLDGLAQSGWELVYTDTPSATFVQHQDELGAEDLSYSIGMAVAKSGVVRSVAWDGPAFRAGLAPGVKLSGVNGQAFSIEALRDAIAASGRTPVALDYQRDGAAARAQLEYSGPLRYPSLRRVVDRPDRLSRLLEGRAG
ncbi:M61 family peptidase [Lysobacter enzymogenes]|uniref:M61 family metallopeptidase n=1 Tax=Lysobacter enzymogenes TaxID=69 RepID=UPI00384D93CA